jgi:hypothetical protein
MGQTGSLLALIEATTPSTSASTTALSLSLLLLFLFLWLQDRGDASTGQDRLHASALCPHAQIGAEATFLTGERTLLRPGAQGRVLAVAPRRAYTPEGRARAGRCQATGGNGASVRARLILMLPQTASSDCS